DVLDHRITPHGSTTKGIEKFLCIATVKLTIPVLQSSRTQIGVQVAMANTEDLFKGAVSDGIKKAAQAFGVAIELAGDDRELAATHALYAPEPSGHTQQVSSPSQQVSRAPAASQAPQDARQAPPQQRNGTPTIQNPAALATEKQVGYLKSLAQRAKYSDEDLDGLIFDQTNGEETIDTLTKGGASACIEWLKAQLS